jgi:hypothetical protein
MGSIGSAGNLTRPAADEFAHRCVQELQVILDNEDFEEERAVLQKSAKCSYQLEWQAKLPWA